MKLDFSTSQWLNQPQHFEITENFVKITTNPTTDFWQRSYYGFSNDNGHALLIENDLNFTFSVRASFRYLKRFDQCGIIMYMNSDNWVKASLEYETPKFSHLGSVVTHMGYSDWATSAIAPASTMWYRLSRRGPDFLIESSSDGNAFNLMRIFHMFDLGETTIEMAKSNPPLPAEKPIRFGLYSCSPLNSSFTVTFDQFKFGKCTWKAYET